MCGAPVCMPGGGTGKLLINQTIRQKAAQGRSSPQFGPGMPRSCDSAGASGTWWQPGHALQVTDPTRHPGAHPPATAEPVPTLAQLWLVTLAILWCDHRTRDGRGDNEGQDPGHVPKPGMRGMSPLSFPNRNPVGAMGPCYIFYKLR